MNTELLDLPITEEWLKASGFRWSQFDRQPDRHWLLWLGSAVRENSGDGRGLVDTEDLGVEVAPGTDGTWFCWLRSDVASRYGRFIHTRHMTNRIELVRLVEALTGQPWSPALHINGSCCGPKAAEYHRKWAQRADVQMMAEAIHRGGHWHDLERDPHGAGANASTLRELADVKAAKI